jgi:exosortase
MDSKWLVVCGGLGVGLLWAYWPTFTEMANRWAHEPQYSHGYLVPLFALFLLWARRKQFAGVVVQPSWWGLGLLALAGGLRIAAAWFYFSWLDSISLLPFVGGLVLLLGGWGVFRLAWPAVAFLAFMLPLPFSLETALAQPLQRIATVTSTYTLQTLGFPALSEGNVILIKEHRIGIVEACSGLSMLLIFFALATAFVLIVPRRPLDRVLLLLSAIPIAVVANVLRITITAVLYETAGSHWADEFHERYAGWVMMPFALLLLALEVWILDHLLVEVEQPRLMTRGLPTGRPTSSPPRPAMPTTP